MDTIKLIARNGDAVREAIELGDIVHMATASEELTDEFMLFAINSGVLQEWAQGFPDPRKTPKSGWTSSWRRPVAARFAGIYSLRKLGYVLQSARVLGELGYSVEVIEAGKGMSRRGTGDEQVISGDVLRKLLVQMENTSTVSTDALAGEVVDTRVGRVRERGSRRTVKGSGRWAGSPGQRAWSRGAAPGVVHPLRGAVTAGVCAGGGGTAPAYRGLHKSRSATRQWPL